ncbi:MAG: hypothetical protein QXG00_06810 [Candidatus Woesearchaeota archaeon]
MSKILALKLVTGEEIIGKTDFSNFTSVNSILIDSTLLKISNIRRVEISGHGGQVGLTLVPFMFTNMDGTVFIQTHNIVAINSDVPKQLEDAYLEHTSGLVMANHS